VRLRCRSSGSTPRGQASGGLAACGGGHHGDIPRASSVGHRGCLKGERRSFPVGPPCSPDPVLSSGRAADGVAGLLFEEAGCALGDGQAGDGFVFGSELFAGGALEGGAVVGVGEGAFQAVELVLLLPCSGEAGLFGVVPPGSCFG